MIKKSFIIALVLLFAGELFALGFQLSFGGGYGFSADKEDYGANYEMNADGEYTEYKDLLASYGNGIKFDFDATILFNDNVGLKMGTGFSMLGGFKSERNSTVSTYESKLTANYLPITVGLKLQAGNGNILPYVYVAPGIFIPIAVHRNRVSKSDMLPESKSETTYKFALGFGVSSGLGLLIKLSDVIGIKFECAPTYASARLKEYTIEDDDGTKSKTIYKKDAKDIPEDTLETRYIRGAPMYSFSSIAAKVGISLDF